MPTTLKPLSLTVLKSDYMWLEIPCFVSTPKSDLKLYLVKISNISTCKQLSYQKHFRKCFHCVVWIISEVFHGINTDTSGEVKYHRITISFELEGTLKGHLVQLPCNEQGHLQLEQVAQSPVQPDLECLQGWASLDNLFQCLITLIVKIFVLISNLYIHHRNWVYWEGSESIWEQVSVLNTIYLTSYRMKCVLTPNVI